MLASEQTNSSPVKKSSTFMGTVQDKLQNIKDFSNWSAKGQMVAVSAVGAMVGALLPWVVVALPSVTVCVVAALTIFFAVKAVQYGYKGLKWSAEKTVDGAKYTAGKVKDASTYAAGKVRDGAVYARDSVKGGYEHSVDSLKKGASFVGEGVANKFHKASGETDYLDKVKRFTPDAIKKSDEIRNDLKAIFADEGNNSGLVNNILSGISSEIDLKIAEEAKSGWEEYIPKLQAQKKFINNLNEKSLHSLLTQRSLPKDTYSIDSIFSDHHDEIKEVIAKCKEDHILKRSLKMRNKIFEEGSARPSRSFSLPSFSSLRRKDSKQSGSLSKSNSLNSIGTVSTAAVSDSMEFATVNSNLLRRSSSSSSLSNGSSKLTPVDPPKVHRSPSIDSGMGSGSSTPTSPLGKLKQSSIEDKISAAMEKNLEEFSSSAKTDTHSSVSNRNGSDSGFSSLNNSPSGSPTRTILDKVIGEIKTQANLKETGLRNKLVGQPSTKVDEAKPESTQVKTVG